MYFPAPRLHRDVLDRGTLLEPMAVEMDEKVGVWAGKLSSTVSVVLGKTASIAGKFCERCRNLNFLCSLSIHSLGKSFQARGYIPPSHIIASFEISSLILFSGHSEECKRKLLLHGNILCRDACLCKGSRRVSDFRFRQELTSGIW